MPSPAVSLNATLIKQNFAVLERRAVQASRYFHAHLFHHHPAARSLLPVDMNEQHDRLLLALGPATEHADNVDALVAYLRQLGFDHRKFGARPEHYPAVGGEPARHAAVLLRPAVDRRSVNYC